MATPLRRRGSRLVERYRVWVEPSASGLPRIRVLLALPALLLVVGAVLVALGINGSSSGAYWSTVATVSDPDLIAGQPEIIRSDEWNTGTAWTISQDQQGFPEENRALGGTDAALPYDLPRWDWSVAFRPHLIGYLLLGVENGTAWRWWMNGFPLIAATSMFVLMFVPRRPVVAAGIGVAFFFSPFFQWWYQSSTFWPATWALVTATAITWVARSDSLRARWIWAAVVAYVSVVMALGIYAPYIIPVVLVVALFAAGTVISLVRSGWGLRRLVARLGPILLAGAVASAVVGIFLATKATTVAEFLGTVYPGARLTEAGDGSHHPRQILRALGASFSESLVNGHGFLGANSSEASSFFFLGVFLIPVALWCILLARRRGLRLPWPLIGLLAAILLFALFAVVPGWDPIAHLLLLDRIPIERQRIGFGVAAIMVVAVLAGELDREENRVPRWIALAGTVGFCLIQLAIAAAKIRGGGIANLQGPMPYWWLYAAASAVAIYAIARRRLAIGVAAFLVATVPLSFLVNPIYRGVLDLRETTVAQRVISRGADGTWVGIGGPVVTALLIESGTKSLNGVQGAPSPEMWSAIDPDGRYERKWNRIGWVNWTEGEGQPVVTNPTRDAVVVTFDSCSAYAQANVQHVLSDHPLDEACLTEVSRVPTAQATFVLYDVTRRSG